MDKGATMKLLKDGMSQVTPLPDEPEFHTSDETIVRYLKATHWKLPDASKAVRQTVEYRRETRPLTQDCQWCQSRPGYHSMRQVGNDESGRPVVYANFHQASTHKNSVDDTVAHVIYLIENAKVTMSAGASTWVFVMDCTGMTLSACNPKLGRNITNILSNHYPERLGLVVCINHNPMFQVVWNGIKKILKPSTIAKVLMLRTEKQIRETFSTYFPEDLASWLLEEISLNKNKPLPKGQREFWNPPISPLEHDPRGCSTYIRQYIDTFKPEFKYLDAVKGKRHCPHPNMIDSLVQLVQAVTVSPTEADEREIAVDESERVFAGPTTLTSSDDEEDDSFVSTSPDTSNTCHKRLLHSSTSNEGLT